MPSGRNIQIRFMAGFQLAKLCSSIINETIFESGKTILPKKLLSERLLEASTFLLHLLQVCHNFVLADPISISNMKEIMKARKGSKGPDLFNQKNNNQMNTDVSTYCMGHITNDRNVLLRILNTSYKNLALLLHSILDLLKKAADREEWELYFSENYISLLVKLVTTMADNFQNQINTAANNSKNSKAADRKEWELYFSENYISLLVKLITTTANNFQNQIDTAANNSKDSVNRIEGEINQTLNMDKQHNLEHLPKLWRIICDIKFESFLAFYW
ncbi:hypothetical protein C2G38_2182721 [Gigaspora rosea]|uniref:Uncharacterized protein n=1 Tax=Gigaspora rosea TaxID=44941 RepID=A0A397VCQ4_9GLOM|nr:hypothetical protein C2G38_2182721 [Gigaspora rosea]